MKLAQEIMDLLIKYSKNSDEYINPNFLGDVYLALEDYYDIQNDEVYGWIRDMWSR